MTISIYGHTKLNMFKVLGRLCILIVSMLEWCLFFKEVSPFETKLELVWPGNATLSDHKLTHGTVRERHYNIHK